VQANEVRGSIDKGSGTSPLEAERLRRARPRVWEYESGSLGPPQPLFQPRTEVVFDGVTMLTAPGLVMTPRPTTEALVDWALEWIGSGSRSVRVADVGTGSGAVAVAVALRAPNARIWATDDSDLLEPVPGELDLVLANLPYHAAARSRDPSEIACRDQPEHAIYAPGDGLQLNRELIDACRTRLAAGGALAIQLYGHLLSANRGELDQLLEEIEARAAEGWEARVAAASEGARDRWSTWQSSPVSEASADEKAEQPPLGGGLNGRRAAPLRPTHSSAREGVS
jgi:hypothetical protein